MKCPVCTTVNLSMSDRQGVEIDYCPQCRGVWLDRGELDKLVERSYNATAPATPIRQPVQQHVQQPVPPQPQHRGYDDRHGYDKDYRARKKKGFLGEIFDFD